MLSHLRFHRRGPSNPTSPIPENAPWDTASLQPTQLVPDNGQVPTPDIEPRAATGVPYGHGHGTPQSQTQLPPPPVHSPPPPPSSAAASQQGAPILPPIARVTSRDSDSHMDLGDFDSRQRDETKPQPVRSPYNADTGAGFIGGLALRTYRQEQAAMRPSSSERADASSHQQTAPLTSPPSRPPAKPNRHGSSFVAPTDLHNNNGQTGKRPSGARVPEEPQGAPAQSLAQEPARTRKGLPFLKNPMSTLLMRRKTSQNIPDLSLQLRSGRGEPSYEPIRGTRVHDFSAPRPRRIVSSNEVPAVQADKPLPDAVPSPVASQTSPVKAAPPVPPKDEQAQSLRTSSSTQSRTVSIDTVSSHKPDDLPSNDLASSISRRGKGAERRKSSAPSRNVSVLSYLPKHMKSTSSRFSFDMIGAANAEKYLEERHRQKQQDKKPDSVGERDSRFDDFDEDGFDYDAMDYDDGLEERIPGVNADYEEEEIPYTNDDYVIEEEDEDQLAAGDPDDDQENFSGFVFQRSGPTSELTSPRSAGLLATPRDASGNVIGFALSKETPDAAKDCSPISPDKPQTHRLTEYSMQEGPTGLGIQGLNEAVEPLEGNAIPLEKLPDHETAPKQPKPDDELYFGGMGHEFDGEGDGSAFDESIFDLMDTDQYGRPIPGMFANVLAQRRASLDVQKRESDDVTSRLSAQSNMSQSTAHTSLSVGGHQNPTTIEGQAEEPLTRKEPEPPLPDLPAGEQEKVDAYGAALAAAAHKAAASGKFRRDSSPPPPTNLTITSPTTSGSDLSNKNLDSLDDYELDDGFSNGLDDYELDDDAIIAEANASALANDSDGWYGQEFGFYSAPAQPVQHGPSSLSEQNLFQYASGGFFGPSGVARTKSGHLVSREPNLTPITERSEYSNRNSIMSLAIPNTGREAPLYSPGLAQLAMMADDDDNMSLSALLRLRSKAWGGSQASLVSSREGSPSDRNGASSPWGQEAREPLGITTGHGRKNSAFSLWSQDSGAGSGAGSPTLTMSMGGIPNSSIPPLNSLTSSNPNSATSPLNAPLFPSSPAPVTFPPVLEDEEADMGDFGDTGTTNSGMWTKPSPASTPATTHDPMSPAVGMPSQKRPGMGHRHKGSADSISYTKEEDGMETRWVMERRRTAESGEIEILGRQIVEGGRI